MSFEKIDIRSAALKDRIIQLRNAVGWSKSETARRIGVSVGTYSNWEYGNRFPSQENIKKICKTYGISPTLLIFGDPYSNDDYYFVAKGRILKFSEDAPDKDLYTAQDGEQIKIDNSNRDLFVGIQRGSEDAALYDTKEGMRNTRMDYKSHHAFSDIISNARLLTIPYIPIDEKRKYKENIVKAVDILLHQSN